MFERQLQALNQCDVVQSQTGQHGEPRGSINRSDGFGRLEGITNAVAAVAQHELGDFIEAAGLLEYDPAAITRIYAGHPQRLLRRLWQTLVPIGLLLIGIGVDKLLGLLSNQERARTRAKEFSNLLVDLGPAFIKAGPVSYTHLTLPTKA